MTTFLRTHRVLIANLGLLLVLTLGASYLAFEGLRWRPFGTTYRVNVDLANSGGLQPNSDVTLNGVRVGKVVSVRAAPQYVTVVADIDGSYKIPRESTASAQNLSAAGEQYLDFRPGGTGSAYLTNGDTVTVAKTRSTVAFPTLLANSVDVIGQIDPGRLQSVTDQLQIALNATGGDATENRLKVLFDSAGSLFGDLYRVLPQTIGLIRDSGTIFATTANIQPDLGRFAGGADALTSALVASDTEVRTLLGTGPAEFDATAQGIARIDQPLTDLLKQLLSLAHQGALRAPALTQLFPAVRDGSAALAVTFHDGAWWSMAAITPRPYCEYAVTPKPMTAILALSIPTNLYCAPGDPAPQVRGAANAPRPPGDDTAGPPKGADPNAMTTPLN